MPMNHIVASWHTPWCTSWFNCKLSKLADHHRHLAMLFLVFLLLTMPSKHFFFNIYWRVHENESPTSADQFLLELFFYISKICPAFSLHVWRFWHSHISCLFVFNLVKEEIWCKSKIVELLCMPWFIFPFYKYRMYIFIFLLLVLRYSRFEEMLDYISGCQSGVVHVRGWKIKLPNWITIVSSQMQSGTANTSALMKLYLTSR